jgi:RecJ-like exonuclease
MFKVICCPSCQGEGYALLVGRPGSYSSRLESYHPTESFVRCDECSGEGEIEVCVICLETLQIIDGVEMCGCAAQELPKAA